MNRGGLILDAMERLIELFARHCSDRSTLQELAALVTNQDRWGEAHELFQRIRAKNLAASGVNPQYVFEEVCAKTLYNLSGAPAPFDADSPYWIVPNALAFARELKLDQAEVLKIITV